MPAHFADVDFTDFWCRGDYADSLSEAPPSPGTIAELEQELGNRLPVAYVELCRHQNGGLPRKCYHAVPHVTSYGAEDHIEIAELYAIGRTAAYSLGNPDSNTAFWVNECEYPALGIYFANCPDHGHQMVALDYRVCGPEGEPAVVLVDEIENYKIVPLAQDFETFIRGLKPEGHFSRD